MKIDIIHNIKYQIDFRIIKKLTLLFAFMSGFLNSGIQLIRAQEIEVDTAIFMRDVIELQEILVNPKKEKYSKRDNPAVLLYRQIRENQKKGDPRNLENYNYEQFTKSSIGLLDFPEEQFENHPFLKDYVDTTRYGGRPVLNVMLNEKGTIRLFSGGTGSQKSIVVGESEKGVSEILESGSANVILNDLLRDVDIYENDITLMSNRFPSPLSAIGADYYKYYIADTLDIDGTRCVQLTFIPRSPESFAFSGNLYVELGDTTGFVKKVSMKVPRTANLNYIDNLYIDQIFEKDSLGFRHLISDELNMDIQIVKGTQKFFAHRESRYDNFSYSGRPGFEDIFNMSASERMLPEDDPVGKEIFMRMRGQSLTEAEWNMDSFMPRLREIPFFYWAEKALVILVGGYIKTGKRSKFDIGPVNTLISTNTVEGIRLRIGGMTTAHLSPNWFARGYIAYGTRDRKWKYKGEVEYSFIKKKYHSREFPINSIRATYMYDLDMIGQHYMFTNPDNIFLSWKRMPNRLMTYRTLARIEYNVELQTQLSLGLSAEHIRQEATKWLPFQNGSGESFSHYGRTSIGIRLRYAPGEKFLQAKSSRFRINREAPVVEISHDWGPRAFPGADFALNKTELSIDKRFWFSAFGYLDALVKGGIIWSRVPYPELLWANANLSYTIQPESYSLMNPMEFAMDRYVSLDLTYWGNGVLFNRIPLVKKLKIREVVGFKGLTGCLTKRNDPTLHPDQFQFPSDTHTGKMGRDPYMELSVGIDNILSVLRIDYVWRLTYRDVAGADQSGLRVALHFNF